MDVLRERRNEGNVTSERANDCKPAYVRGPDGARATGDDGAAAKQSSSALPGGWRGHDCRISLGSSTFTNDTMDVADELIADTLGFSQSSSAWLCSPTSPAAAQIVAAAKQMRHMSPESDDSLAACWSPPLARSCDMTCGSRAFMSSCERFAPVFQDDTSVGMRSVTAAPPSPVLFLHTGAGVVECFGADNVRASGFLTAYSPLPSQTSPGFAFPDVPVSCGVEASDVNIASKLCSPQQQHPDSGDPCNAFARFLSGAQYATPMPEGTRASIDAPRASSLNATSSGETRPATSTPDLWQRCAAGADQVSAQPSDAENGGFSFNVASRRTPVATPRLGMGAARTASPLTFATAKPAASPSMFAAAGLACSSPQPTPVAFTGAMQRPDKPTLSPKQVAAIVEQQNSPFTALRHQSANAGEMVSSLSQARAQISAMQHELHGLAAAPAAAHATHPRRALGAAAPGTQCSWSAPDVPSLHPAGAAGAPPGTPPFARLVRHIRGDARPPQQQNMAREGHVSSAPRETVLPVSRAAATGAATGVNNRAQSSEGRAQPASPLVGEQDSPLPVGWMPFASLVRNIVARRYQSPAVALTHDAAEPPALDTTADSAPAHSSPPEGSAATPAATLRCPLSDRNSASVDKSSEWRSADAPRHIHSLHFSGATDTNDCSPVSGLARSSLTSHVTDVAQSSCVADSSPVQREVTSVRARLADASGRDASIGGGSPLANADVVRAMKQPGDASAAVMSAPQLRVQLETAATDGGREFVLLHMHVAIEPQPPAPALSPRQGSGVPSAYARDAQAARTSPASCAPPADVETLRMSEMSDMVVMGDITPRDDDENVAPAALAASAAATTAPDSSECKIKRLASSHTTRCHASPSPVALHVQALTESMRTLHKLKLTASNSDSAECSPTNSAREQASVAAPMLQWLQENELSDLHGRGRAYSAVCALWKAAQEQACEQAALEQKLGVPAASAVACTVDASGDVISILVEEKKELAQQKEALERDKAQLTSQLAALEARLSAHAPSAPEAKPPVTTEGPAAAVPASPTLARAPACGDPQAGSPLANAVMQAASAAVNGTPRAQRITSQSIIGVSDDVQAALHGLQATFSAASRRLGMRDSTKTAVQELLEHSLQLRRQLVKTVGQRAVALELTLRKVLAWAREAKGSLEELLRAAAAQEAAQGSGASADTFEADAIVMSMRFHFATTFAKLREWPAELSRAMSAAGAAGQRQAVQVAQYSKPTDSTPDVARQQGGVADELQSILAALDETHADQSCVLPGAATAARSVASPHSTGLEDAGLPLSLRLATMAMHAHKFLEQYAAQTGAGATGRGDASDSSAHSPLRTGAARTTGERVALGAGVSVQVIGEDCSPELGADTSFSTLTPPPASTAYADEPKHTDPSLRALALATLHNEAPTLSLSSAKLRPGSLQGELLTALSPQWKYPWNPLFNEEGHSATTAPADAQTASLAPSERMPLGSPNFSSGATASQNSAQTCSAADTASPCGGEAQAKSALPRVSERSGAAAPARCTRTSRIPRGGQQGTPALAGALDSGISRRGSTVTARAIAASAGSHRHIASAPGLTSCSRASRPWRRHSDARVEHMCRSLNIRVRSPDESGSGDA